MARLGAHESVAGGLELAFERIDQVGGKALQIFTRNQRQWNPKPLSNEEIERFGRAWDSFEDMEVASHGSYLVNLASGKEEQVAKSVTAMAGEIKRCRELDLNYLVTHPGSHGGDGVEAGLERYVRNLDAAMDLEMFDGLLLLETTAGQGTSLGASFEEIGYIISNSRYKKHLGVCLDTCHIFAAGYDIRTEEGYHSVIQSFDQIIGLDRLCFFHLNDSKKCLGSRVDRHEHIGRGEIGPDGFRFLMNDPRFAEHSMTLETPKGKELKEDRENLATLRSFIG